MELLTLLAYARKDVPKFLQNLGFISRFGNRRKHVLRKNTKQMARENIHEHYDLGNPFFKLFLDESLTYSSALFLREGESLEQGQFNKNEALCQMAQLKPGDSVLEIGTGWGGFAIHAAKKGCKVTTISISKEQVALAKQRVEQAGLSSLVEVRLQDYREVTGSFDKIVSIEMFEAVGYEFFETFFKKCDAVLKPGGRMAMQVITLADRDFEAQRKGVNYIQKHIFPGGLLPSLAEIEKATAHTSLNIVEARDIGSHYALTLAEWRKRFHRNLLAVRRLGFTDVFIRKWDYYLAQCQVGFAVKHLHDQQIVFEKQVE